MEGRVSFAGSVDCVVEAVHAWGEAGATHVSINTMDAGLARVDDHLRVLCRVAAKLALA
jgi:hypothetical protein